MEQFQKKWQTKYNNFHYVPVISNTLTSSTQPESVLSKKEQKWAGRTGLVHQAVLEDFPSLKDFQVYASGSPGMIYAIYDDFVKHGLDKDSMTADAFDYAPRE